MVSGALGEDNNLSGSRCCYHYNDGVLDIISFAFSERGNSHISSGKPCQDSSLIKRFDGGVFVCTADGHGGDDYIRSDRGSMLCCESAYACMTDRELLSALNAAADRRTAEKLITQLKKSVICRWNELIADDLALDPFTEEEFGPLEEKVAERYRAGEYIERAYGTTLLAAVVTESFCLVIQLGDGRCVILSDGEYSSPMPEDEKCVFNTTTSMCDSRAFSEMRHCFFSETCEFAEQEPAAVWDDVGEEGSDAPADDNNAAPDRNGRHGSAAADTGMYSGVLPEAVILCTDGISNSFSSDDKLYDFYYMVTENFCESSGSEEELGAAIAELREFSEKISKKGSGDDVSLAAVIRVK